MEMARALVGRAARSLDGTALATALHGPLRELLRLRGELSAGSSGASPLRSVRSSGAPIEAWNLSDAVWRELARRRPELGHHPLGDGRELAVKKMLAALVDGSPNGRPHHSPQGEPVAALGRILAHTSEEELAESLLTHLLFEIAVDRLRRPGAFGRGYAFTREDRAVSLRAETWLRTALMQQCRFLAREWLSAVKETDGTSLVLDDDRIGEACNKVLRVRPARRRSRPDGRWVNVICGPRAKKPGWVAAHHELARPPLRLLVHDRRYNFSFSFDPFEGHLGRPLRSLTRDLLDLGVAIYASDLHTTRHSIELDRRTGLLISLRHPEVWKDAADEVRRVVADLGRDDFTVHFAKLQERRTLGPFHLADDGRCVCLFSGGLDSLAGAAWALDQGLEPLFVSHYARPELSGTQKGLLERLAGAFDRDELPHVSFYAANRKQPRGGRRPRNPARWPLRGQKRSPMAQYLRSFLFLSGAAALALEKGIRRVYVFENGPIALNPSISEGRVSTRTAHPHVLARFARLIERVFGVELRIENPFRYLTKGEVARLLGPPGLLGSIAASESCWNSFNIALSAGRMGRPWNGEKHDGDCLPCLVRRAALCAAGLSEHDAPYLIDVFSEYPDISQAARLRVADLLRFCRTVLALDDEALLQRVPELSVYEPGTDGQKLAEMLRRHAAEMRKGFRDCANEPFQRDFQALL